MLRPAKIWKLPDVETAKLLTRMRNGEINGPQLLLLVDQYLAREPVVKELVMMKSTAADDLIKSVEDGTLDDTLGYWTSDLCLSPQAIAKKLCHQTTEDDVSVNTTQDSLKATPDQDDNTDVQVLSKRKSKRVSASKPQSHGPDEHSPFAFQYKPTLKTKLTKTILNSIDVTCPFILPVETSNLATVFTRGFNVAFHIIFLCSLATDFELMCTHLFTSPVITAATTVVIEIWSIAEAAEIILPLLQKSPLKLQHTTQLEVAHPRQQRQMGLSPTKVSFWFLSTKRLQHGSIVDSFPTACKPPMTHDAQLVNKGAYQPTQCTNIGFWAYFWNNIFSSFPDVHFNILDLSPMLYSKIRGLLAYITTVTTIPKLSFYTMFLSDRVHSTIAQSLMTVIYANWAKADIDLLLTLCLKPVLLEKRASPNNKRKRSSTTSSTSQSQNKATHSSTKKQHKKPKIVTPSSSSASTSDDELPDSYY